MKINQAIEKKEKENSFGKTLITLLSLSFPLTGIDCKVIVRLDMVTECVGVGVTSSHPLSPHLPLDSDNRPH